jgi:hypothetical protein
VKKIRKRLRKTRVKLARVLRLLEASHRETHRQWAKARSARQNAAQARKQGRLVDARKAERRADFHQAKARRWERRTDWLAGKKRYLTERERQLLARKEKWVKAHPDPGPPSAGTSTFEGGSVQIANWMIPWLKKSREHGWSGYVYSGYRTPAYSESLCQHMCGRPSCSGTCAGRSSNHACPPSATCKPYEGAVDLTDYLRFGQIQYAIGSPLRNHLPYDRVHYSASGY